MITLAAEQASRLIELALAVPEGPTIEFKRVSGKMIQKALETVCAFSNSGGGHLFLGLEDPNKASGVQRTYGIEENAEAIDEFLRKLAAQFLPPLSKPPRLRKVPCTLRNGEAGHILWVYVEPGEAVHSIVDDGTWLRYEASNRQMSASEVTELSYRRGSRSAVAEPVDIQLALLETPTWHRFKEARGLKTGTFAEQLCRIGLAVKSEERVLPTRAAVLLFAEEPSGLLASHSSRADIRFMVYDGKVAQKSAKPNFRKTPQTIRGPVVDQIDRAVSLVLRELEDGLTLSTSGFRAKHVYPERVVKEAIVNAVVHRDYRLNRDIFVRVFDDRIEVESPGALPGAITPANIAKAGSKARNALLVQNLREFPDPPNIDGGEGVPMMFAEMAAAQLYPPQYRQNSEGLAVETVTVTLINLERPTAWDEVSHWIDEHGEIANAQLRDIAKVDTLKASKMLSAWVEQGVLVAQPGRGKRNTAYTKPAQSALPTSLFSEAVDKNAAPTKKDL